MKKNLTPTEAADFINRSFSPPPRTYGDALVEAALHDKRIVALCADLVTPTETDRFRDELPERFLNTGIAEANMIGMAGGMARSGEIPFCHSFCAFITKRVMDQITMQAAYPNLPVKMIGFLPGITTLLGVSHQAIEDLAIMRAVPNMAIFEPSGPEYHAAMVKMALEWDGPVYIRMKRPESAPEAFTPKSLSIGKGVICREGNDLTIISSGICVKESLLAAAALAEENIEARVIDIATIKPLDEPLIIESAEKTGAIITVENHSIIGGLGSAVAETLMDHGIGLPFKRIGIKDTFCEGGSTSYLMRKFGLDHTGIYAAAEDILQRKRHQTL